MDNKFLKNIFDRRKKQIVFFVFFAFLILLFPENRKAQAWDAAPANAMLFGLETIKESISETILSSIKMEAITFLNQEVDNTINMVTGEKGALGVVNGFVEDWEAFLVEEPGNQAASYLEEFLFNATGGRSSSNYRSKVGRSANRYSMGSEGFGNETVYYGLIRSASAESPHLYDYDDGGAAYRAELKNLSEAIKDEKQAEWGKQTDEPDYERNPKMMFAKDNLRDMDIYFSGINNPWSYDQYKNMKLENNYQNKKAELSLRVLIGKGLYFDDIRDSVTESDIQSYTSTMDLEMLANAKSAPETAVAFALVKINKVLRKAIRNVRKSYQKDLAVYRNQIMTSFKGQFAGGRPQDVFKQQLQDKQARQNKFGTGANYESINVNAEIQQRQALRNRILQTSQLP